MHFICNFESQSTFDMTQNDQLEQIKQIRHLMQKSSKFLSLSGLSGISAGVIALIAAFIATQMINDFSLRMEHAVDFTEQIRQLEFNLLILAAITLSTAIVFGYLFTQKKARKSNEKVWNSTSKRMLLNLTIPLITGGIFISSLLIHNYVYLIAPATLIFYGLALINASKYTLVDIKFLGLSEIALGLLASFFLGYGLLFWSIGFGILHILYGIIMYIKYDRS